MSGVAPAQTTGVTRCVAAWLVELAVRNPFDKVGGRKDYDQNELDHMILQFRAM